MTNIVLTSFTLSVIMKTLRRFFFISTFLAILVSNPLSVLNAQNEITLSSGTITLPIRVHRFTSDEDTRLNCSLSDAEIRQQFEAVNETWAQAAIVWEIESIIDVVARKPKDFAKAMDNPRGTLAKALASNMPRKHLLKDGFNVVIAEDYGRSIGGVFMPNEDGLVFYAKKGPKGIQTPAVLAHELGHSLGLPHTIFEKDNNLMMGSGAGRVPTLTKPITASQIMIARLYAMNGKPFNPPRVKAPSSSPKKIFAMLDTNKDEIISLSEVKKTHRAFVIDFFRKASRSAADSLSREEYDFILAQRDQPRQRSQQRRQPQQGQQANQRAYGPEIVPQIFSRFDSNKDDQITRKEASRPGSLVNEYFDKWDSETNGDGILTREEVLARLFEAPAAIGALKNVK